MHRTATTTALLGAGLALLAGCAAPPDHVVGCMFELEPPGAYEWPATDAVPAVVPGEGGTPEGAMALNACIQARAEAAGQAPASTSMPGWLTGVNEARAIGDVVAVTQDMDYSRVARRFARSGSAPESCSLDMMGGTAYACRR